MADALPSAAHRMVMALLDLRRARQRRVTLAMLNAAGLALPLVAHAAPRWAPWLGQESPFPVVAAGLAFAVSVAAWAHGGTSARWSALDGVAWTLSLAVLACLGALGTAPVTVGMFLHGGAMMLVALRVPRVEISYAAGFTVLGGTVVRAFASHHPGAVLAYALVATLMLMAHTLLARAAHSLVLVLAEREALLADRRERPPRHRERSSNSGTSTLRALRAAAAAAQDERPVETASPADEGWDGVVDRLRNNLAALCGDAGASATVHAELRGLAPPNSKMRHGVLKLGQEAANHTLRETDPRSIAVTLRRGEGGLVIEFADDGSAGDGGRKRKALASIRGRVAALGGSADVHRADAGWVLRVRLPCEQLN